MIDSECVGSLNLYSRSGHGFGGIDAALLQLFTTAAEGALRGARRHLAARQLAEQLRHALQSRSVIDQAKGILMAARGLTGGRGVRRADEAVPAGERQGPGPGRPVRRQGHPLRRRQLAAASLARLAGQRAVVPLRPPVRADTALTAAAVAAPVRPLE
ncbi:ANTAR domain-containing protein [Gandjariella thermophila]|nr:ANTAR domain-containing protein [Gandjariella thermophila]